MATITSGQIKATANKIIEDLQNQNKLAVEDYERSLLKQEDFEMFKATDAVVKALYTAKQLIDADKTNRIFSINVFTGEFSESNTYYRYMYETVEKNTDVDALVEKLFNNRLKYELPFETPTLAEVITKVTYYTITVGNLLQIEEEIKNDLYKGQLKTNLTIYE